MNVFVFHDGDHGDVEVFATLELAKGAGWPDDEEWEDDGTNEWQRGEYCRIYKKKVHE